uniref:Uncharacterized protein n=1 Tax=Salix viminalis TaxID=40686 RepID=A0A6N2JZA2_SALVM
MDTNKKKISLSLKFTNQSLITRRDRFLTVYYVSIKFTYLPLSREGEEDRIVENHFINLDFISAGATNILASIPFLWPWQPMKIFHPM